MPVNPDRTRSSLARAFFAQAGYLMSKGYHGTIDYDTFWSLDPQNQPERLLTLYSKYEQKIDKSKYSSFFPWLFTVLAKCTWFHFSAGCLLTFFDVLLTLADPIFLKLIISSVENNYPLWYGFTLVVVYSFFTWLKLVGMARSIFYTLLAYMDVQSILLNVIYRKMIKLSLSAKTRYSAGEVINLLTTDIERIQMVWFNLLDFIYSPLMILFCLTGLSLIIGINVLYGIAVILSSFPLNGFLIKIATKCENRQMELKDARLKLMTDVLSGVKVLKLYAWEKSMHSRLSKIRTAEVIQLKYATYCYSLMEITFSSCPILATIASFAGYIIIQGNPLTPQVAFITLMLFGIMRISIYQIPKLIQEIINAKISLNRVQDFLKESEIPDIINSMEPTAENVIVQFENANFSWSCSVENENSEISQSVLKQLSFKINEGELIGIVGRVGAGKSSLLSSICGELYQNGGKFFRKSPVSIAYVPQEAWIQNLTLRNNILFGKGYDEIKYFQTIESCALKDDLKMFPAGDATEIGERGLNLSGGQKARVALARAVYQSADLYILDDTLSAVDSHVGAHIFENVIGNDGILKGKTRIFALNSISFLSKCDRIIVMKEGNIVDCGTYVELLARENKTFTELVKELAIKKKSQTEIDDAIAEEDEDVLNELVGAASIREYNRSISTNSAGDLPSPLYRRRRTTSSSNPPITPVSFHHSISHQQDEDFARLIDDEEIGTGKVSYKIYWSYAKVFGVPLIIGLFLILFIFRNIFESVSQIWIAKWSSFNSSSADSNDIENLEIYAFFALFSCILGGVSAAIIAIGAYKASKKMHENLLFSLLRSPMSFFDTTPLGRILNRLSKDIEKMDKEVPKTLAFSLISFSECIFGILMSIYILPYLGIISVIMLIIFVFGVRYYTYASVQIRRLTSKAWSSVASHAQDSYIGVNTLRVFGVQERFMEQMLQKGVKCTESDLAEITSNR
uniref:P-loop containing nucleoside triphosphate hydrolase protein n=1 Tax=Panagrolaimus davidi TaxID=227884 RepID=A0A914QLQ8_9BILA